MSSRRRAFAGSMLRWGLATRRNFPWRAGRASPYKVLMAEVALKRTTSTAALRAFKELTLRYPDFAALELAEQHELERLLTTVGLQRQRAKGLKELADFVVKRYRGILPQDLGSLMAIPHVGPYTARAVLSFAFGIPAAVVDSNVVRVLGRFFSPYLSAGPTQGTFQALADLLLPKRHHRDFNFALLGSLGATVCRYVEPKCPVCPLKSKCGSVHPSRPHRQQE